MSKIGSRVIFVGNIPYEFSETQVVEIFSEIGQVVGFRLVFDRETGKPKGYGFLTYQDHETAASAVRNLNNYDIGGRGLRVDFADSDKETGDLKKFPNPNAPGNTGPSDMGQEIIQRMTPLQIVELLGQLKFMVMGNLEGARGLLTSQPHLTFAVFQVLLQMGMVDQFTMQRILSTQTSHASHGHPMEHQNQSQPLPIDQKEQIQQQQQQLLQRLLQLTPEQISELPIEQQQQIMMLKQQVMG